MAVDLTQPVAVPADTPAPVEAPQPTAPEAVVPETPPEATPPEGAPPEPTPPPVAETPKPTEPDVNTRISALEKQYQQTAQERDYYRTSYEQQTQQQAEAAVQAADEKRMGEIRREWDAQVAPKLAKLDPESREYADLYNSEYRRLETDWKDYLLEKKDKALATREQEMLKRSAELGRDQFYQAASVTHRMPLEKLKRELPRTDGINTVDTAARFWRMGYDEATRSLSASKRIEEGVDNVPIGAGTGGQGLRYLEDAEEALSIGKISWDQFQSLRDRLKYKDGTSASY